ncbi:Protein roadkill [Aphelenchoides bicaudatus]|nr:Protein roadkill [Aphelenchoides bicaudatus]
MHCELSYSNTIGKKISVKDDALMFRNNLWNLYKEGQDFDTTFKVDGVEFKVHRIIFTSQSPVFKQMFLTNCEEAKTKIVNIEDFSAEVFEDFVYWMYLGNFQKLDENAEELFILADKYQIEKLQTTCSDYLCTTLDEENAAHLLIHSTLHNDDNLKNYILDEFSIRPSVIKLKLFLSKEWKQFCINYEQDAEQIEQLFCSKCKI